MSTLTNAVGPITGDNIMDLHQIFIIFKYFQPGLCGHNIQGTERMKKGTECLTNSLKSVSFVAGGGGGGVVVCIFGGYCLNVQVPTNGIQMTELIKFEERLTFV